MALAGVDGGVVFGRREQEEECSIEGVGGRGWEEEGLRVEECGVEETGWERERGFVCEDLRGGGVRGDYDRGVEAVVVRREGGDGVVGGFGFGGEGRCGGGSVGGCIGGAHGGVVFAGLEPRPG